MEIIDARIGVQIDALIEAIIQPGGKGQGWVMQFRDIDDTLLPLTYGGHTRIFDDLNHATRLAEGLGFLQVSVMQGAAWG